MHAPARIVDKSLQMVVCTSICLSPSQRPVKAGNRAVANHVYTHVPVTAGNSQSWHQNC